MIGRAPETLDHTGDEDSVRSLARCLIQGLVLASYSAITDGAFESQLSKPCLD